MFKVLNVFNRINVLKAILLVWWVSFVLYPNPYYLAVSVYRLKNPPIQPVLVTDTARELKGLGPGEIEEYVYARLPYRFDWQVYNMPWYFPSLEEALAGNSGDCKARFILFASLLEELNIPYRRNISLTHIWIDYEGKAESALENRMESMFVTDESGNLHFSLPRPDLDRATRSFRRGFWEVMPPGRKYLLLTGFPLILALFHLPPFRPPVTVAGPGPAGKKHLQMLKKQRPAALPAMRGKPRQAD